jgi:hypothetical protein
MKARIELAEFWQASGSTELGAVRKGIRCNIGRYIVSTSSGPALMTCRATRVRGRLDRAEGEERKETREVARAGSTVVTRPRRLGRVNRIILMAR